MVILMLIAIIEGTEHMYDVYAWGPGIDCIKPAPENFARDEFKWCISI